MTKSQVSTIRNTRKVWNYYDFAEDLSQKAVLIQTPYKAENTVYNRSC